MSVLYDKEYVKKKLKEVFDIEATAIKLLGNGWDSEAYLINEAYVFKFARHKLASKDYAREKRILDFLKENLKTNIKVPNIEYFDNSTETGIMGYKRIEGIILSPEIYQRMSREQKEKLALDISEFLKELHSLNSEELIEYTTDNREGCIKDLKLLKEKIYNILSEEDIKFVETIFEKILNNNKIFNGKKCLCHNDLSCNHIILNENYELAGIIDFGDACITDEYSDFLFLLEDSEEEVGRDFGLKVLKEYGMKDVETALEYADIKEEYYPIELICWGIKDEDRELVEKGLEIVREQKYTSIKLTSKQIEEMHFVKVMFGTESKASKEGVQYKIGEINETDNWNPKTIKLEIMGGFSISTEESILRWLIRGDTIYDVTIPENTEVYDCWSPSAPHGVFRTNRIIINNPRQVDDAFAMKLYEKSKLPEKSYYAALAICVIRGYMNTALKILRDKVDKNNIDEVIEVFKDWHKNRESGKFIEEELKDNGRKMYEMLLAIQ